MLLRAFPSALCDDVTAVARVMPRPGHPAAKRRERVLVQSETIEIPYRIYNPEPPADAVEGMTTDRSSSSAASTPVITTAT
jgi:hypothetical protein